MNLWVYGKLNSQHGSNVTWLSITNKVYRPSLWICERVKRIHVWVRLPSPHAGRAVRTQLLSGELCADMQACTGTHDAQLTCCARLWHASAMLCSIKLHECEHVLMNVLYTAQCDAQWKIKQLTWGAPSTWLGARVYLLDDEILAMGLLCKRTETLDPPSW